MKTVKLIILASLIGCGDFTKTKLETGVKLSSTQSAEAIATDWEDSVQSQFTLEKMGSSLAANVLIPLSAKFAKELVTLDQNINDYCQDISSQNELKAKDQWWKTNEVFHQFELYDIGPLAGENGTELKSSFSTWPDFASCTLDKEIALMAKNPQGYNLKNLSNRKTLTALEYLLFSKTDHTCSKLKPTDDLAIWSNKTAKEKKSDKCQYMKLVTKDLLNQSKVWQRRWGFYADSLLSIEAFVQEMSDSFFLADTLLQDVKLGDPLGYDPSECESGQCTELVEHSWSNKSIKAFKANLDGLQFLLYGNLDKKGQALGLYGMIIKNGKNEVYERMQAQLKVIDDHLILIDSQTTFIEAVASNDPVECANGKSVGCALFGDIKILNDLIKTDFIVAISTQASKQAEGDSD